ncbi:LTA synthase family protein [Vagococcus fessus]|uniref:LTA synthase family protein n=1 Tax=Vagococcus fessus TaxID=120370 RepID=UPI000F881766|nr:alkaline phosphatase family protein [Vagococcus fessus]
MLKKLGRVFLVLVIAFISHVYLQLAQNHFSWQLVSKFILSWHTEKFILGTFVLLSVWAVCYGIVANLSVSLLVYSLGITVLGLANYQKIKYRMEPLYPDDLKMITEWSVLKDMVGPVLVIGLVIIIMVLIGIIIYWALRSLKLPKNRQIYRGIFLLIGLVGVGYSSQFNSPDNLLRKGYNRTALWVPYSQEMNYYNTGFVGGFLYNLKVEPMVKPRGYSKDKIAEIVKTYQTDKGKTNATDQPNIVFVMSESFSDPGRLTGPKFSRDTLQPYHELARQTYSGQMLSQNYGGGTANIEFEALTGISLEPLNPQMTTPYTMLVPKLEELPSIVSVLKNEGYEATAIHPYNTSMYKRKDVYNVLGFDQFISEKEMTYQDKIENNSYISDESAFSEVVKKLNENQKEQFIHLVTMQTHMPYSEKYQVSNQQVSGVENPISFKTYLEDIGYTSQALDKFVKELKALDRRTLVVFWGDHLPGIYGEQTKKNNGETALHLTEFMMIDSEDTFKPVDSGEDSILSPIYFGPKLFEKIGKPLPGYYELLSQLEKGLPAFEKNRYYSNGKWSKERTLSEETQKVYEDYELISYDLVSGHRYSVEMNFYKE